MSVKIEVLKTFHYVKLVDPGQPNATPPVPPVEQDVPFEEGVFVEDVEESLIEEGKWVEKGLVRIV